MEASEGCVLVLGSGPGVVMCSEWPRGAFTDVVAINNAWRVRPDWDYLVYPEDFPSDRRPVSLSDRQALVEADAFVPAQNAYGGFVYAGGTMAFTTAYWVLHALRPRVMGFLGCDMVYAASGQTHFYGKGTADPLRPDVTLQSLEAKSARLALMAAMQGCACVNFSTDDSRLVFPRATPDSAADATVDAEAARLAAAAPLARERELGYMVPSGRYWEVADQFDAAALAALDSQWLTAYREPVPC